MKNINYLRTNFVRALLALAIAMLILFSGPITRVTASPGDIDSGFGNGGKVVTPIGLGSYIADIAIQPDGKIIAGGESFSLPIYYGGDFALARYNKDGSLDASFGSGGIVITDFFGDEDYIKAVAVQSDGKIVAVGQARNGVQFYFGIARYNSDGSLDSSFGSGGKVTTDFFGYGSKAWDVDIQPDGKIIVAGHAFRMDFFGYFIIARYNSDGTLDTSFGSGGRASFNSDNDSQGEAKAIALQADGKIVVAGAKTSRETNSDFAVARFNNDGSFDPSFNSGHPAVTDFTAHGPDQVSAVALLPDGKILVVGSGSILFSRSALGMARYNSDGSLDQSFGSGGKVNNEQVFFGAAGVVALANGKFVVAGFGLGAVAQYNSDGNLDTSFGRGRGVSSDSSSGIGVRALALQPDGKLVVGGSAAAQFALARYDAEDVLASMFDIHLQASSDGSILEFSSETGDYRLADCSSGLTFIGRGSIEAGQCKVRLRDDRPDRYLSAKVNLCAGTSKATMEVFSRNLTFKIKDKNITDGVSPCR